MKNTSQLRDLELLRRYDVGGRVPGAAAPSMREALRFLEDVSHDIAPYEGAESDEPEAR